MRMNILAHNHGSTLHLPPSFNPTLSLRVGSVQRGNRGSIASPLAFRVHLKCSDSNVSDSKNLICPKKKEGIAQNGVLLEFKTLTMIG